MAENPLDFLDNPYRSPQSVGPPPLPKPKAEGFTIVEYLVAFFVSFPLSWILFWLIMLPLSSLLHDVKPLGELVIGLLFLVALLFPFAVVVFMRKHGRRRF